jgi:hypothetical protein
MMIHGTVKPQNMKQVKTKYTPIDKQQQHQDKKQ